AVVGDARVAAVGPEAPPVEGADELTALDAPAEAEVRAEVRAVGVHHVRESVLAAPDDEVAREEPQREQRPGGHLLRIAGGVPREGEGGVVGEALDRAHARARELALPRERLERRLARHHAIGDAIPARGARSAGRVRHPPPPGPRTAARAGLRRNWKRF